MIEQNNKNISNLKRQMSRGRLQTNKNKRIKGGDLENRSFNAEEFNFQSINTGVGLAGQIALNRVDENGNAYIDMIALGAAGEFTLTGAIIPSIDAGGIGGGAVLGSASKAFGYMRSYFFSTASDRRLKKNIKDIEYGLDTIKKIRPVSYKFKKGEDVVKLGFVAQELMEYIPEVVDGSEDTMYGVSYDELVPILVKAVQELSKEVEDLNKKLD